MNLIFEFDFKRQYKKIKNKVIWSRIDNTLLKLKQNPTSGKPLKYSLKNHRSLRVGKYRIIYRIKNNDIIILCFDHRKSIYEEILMIFSSFILILFFN